MPVNIPDNLPAAGVLAQENIFTMNRTSAIHQDIRPLKIAILNLMPLKEATETSLIRLLSNTPLQIEVDLIRTKSYFPVNTDKDHLESFYKTFDEIQEDNYDGMIITGAPVEHLDFSEVKYWPEMQLVMDWARKHVTSTLYLCWAAMAGLYHHYGIPKRKLENKLFGVFDHICLNHQHSLFRGFDAVFPVPHSRFSEVKKEDVERIDELEILAFSELAGIHIVSSIDNRSFFITGHAEYEWDTLKHEYLRDVKKGIEIAIPEHYFPDNDPGQKPLINWRAQASLLYSNWLNFFVYQETPYDLDKIIQY